MSSNYLMLTSTSVTATANRSIPIILFTYPDPDLLAII